MRPRLRIRVRSPTSPNAHSGTWADEPKRAFGAALAYPFAQSGTRGGATRTRAAGGATRRARRGGRGGRDAADEAGEARRTRRARRARRGGRGGLAGAGVGGAEEGGGDA